MLKTDEGYDVRIDHFRLGELQARLLKSLPRKEFVKKILFYAQSLTELRASKSTVSPRGGLTVAQIYDGDTMIAEGAALCSPDDNFNKRIGRDIAVGRALKELRA